MNIDVSTQALYYVLIFQATLMILLRCPESYTHLFRRLRKKLVGVKAKRLFKRAISTNKKLAKYEIIQPRKFK